MNKPVIGIVCTVGTDPTADDREVYFVGTPYVDRVIEAGGFPILLPHGVDAAQAAELLDGWLVIGGRDIDPSRYGQDPHPDLEIERSERFELESAIYDASPPSMPILGICYGCQFLNVKRGGDLVQHVPDQVGHGEHAGGTMQRYTVKGGTTAAALGTTSAQGKSYHHQAIGKPGQGLKVVAEAEDGTIEAVEDLYGKWVVGVQWHPERSPDLPESINLFKSFVDRAAEFKKERETCGTW